MFLDLWFALFYNRVRIWEKLKVAQVAFLIILFWTFSVWGDSVPTVGIDKSIVSQPDEGMILISEGPFTMGSSKEDIEWVVRTFHSASLGRRFPSHMQYSTAPSKWTPTTGCSGLLNLGLSQNLGAGLPAAFIYFLYLEFVTSTLSMK